MLQIPTKKFKKSAKDYVRSNDANTLKKFDETYSPEKIKQWQFLNVINTIP